MVDIMPGKVYSMFVGLGNSLRGLIDVDKITFLLLYTNPTQKEMADFAATTSIQVRLFTKSEMFFYAQVWHLSVDGFIIHTTSWCYASASSACWWI